jgi:lipoprotein-anchoring transpeptidase ErfK/SrfK
VGGSPVFLLAGQRLTITGKVTPYAAAQQVVVRIYRGRGARSITVPVQPGPAGNGTFTAHYRTGREGRLSVRALHAATPQLPALVSGTARLRVVSHSAHPGSGGFTVRTLQDELTQLGYVVPVNGRFDAGTGRGVIAYRKVVGMSRVPIVNSDMMHRLQRGRGEFHVRFRHHGRHIEADLAHQVLAEILPGGRVQRIYTMSSGKPSTPTVVGNFRVYSKTPGTNAKGMVDANYFVGGYAIHGYAQVPNYPASHGCLRIPIPDAGPVFGWTQIGTPVDVYARHGGSHHVRHHGVGP